MYYTIVIDICIYQYYTYIVIGIWYMVLVYVL